MGGITTYLADNVKSGAGVATKVRTGRDRAVGHDRSGNISLDKHPVCQSGVGRLVLLRSQGVQDGSINSQRSHRRSSASDGRWGRSRSNTPSGIGVLIALGGDASEERASRSIVGVAVSARRTVASGRLGRRGSALGARSSTIRDFGVDEAAPFAIGARSGDPEGLGGH